MLKFHSLFKANKITRIVINTGLVGASFLIPFLHDSPKTFANPSLLEYRWDNSSNYKKLYYSQSSNDRRDRSTYYLVLNKKNRRSAILKLKITIPDYFNANISTKKLTLCRVSLGGMLSRTKCIEKIPAVFEVAKGQSSIEVFPDQPIPADDQAYAVVMKIFNPDKAGMFQLNALAQAPGDMPVSTYLGSWNISID